MRRSYLLTLQWVSLSAFVAAVLFSLPSCGTTPDFWGDAKPNQKKVLVTFPPLYSIAHAVAGEDAYVLCMLTTNGPHGYQGAATDLFMVNKADAFFYNGLTLDDDFVKKMLANHKNRSLLTVEVGDILAKQHPELMKKGDGKWHVLEGGGKHKHGDLDPHIWLAPNRAIEMTKIVRDKLIEIDPANKDGYKKRAAKYIGELEDLQRHGIAAFKDKKNKKIVTMHEAFAYFADAFDIKIVDSIQLQPGMDSDSVKMSKLIELCRAPDGPRVIAVEPQYPAAQAEMIQKSLQREGIQVRIVTLDPLETADVAKGQKFNPDPGHYLKKMRENIDTLAKALP